MKSTLLIQKIKKVDILVDSLNKLMGGIYSAESDVSAKKFKTEYNKTIKKIQLELDILSDDLKIPYIIPEQFQTASDAENSFYYESKDGEPEVNFNSSIKFIDQLHRHLGRLEYKLKNEQKSKLHKVISQPKFDTKKSKILMGKLECEIPYKTIEYYVAEKLFENSPETKVSETALFECCDRMISDSTENEKRIYDARRRINKKIKGDLGIDKLIEYKSANYWVKKIP